MTGREGTGDKRTGDKEKSRKENCEERIDGKEKLNQMTKFRENAHTHTECGGVGSFEL